MRAETAKRRAQEQAENRLRNPHTAEMSAEGARLGAEGATETQWDTAQPSGADWVPWEDAPAGAIGEPDDIAAMATALTNASNISGEPQATDAFKPAKPVPSPKAKASGVGGDQPPRGGAGSSAPRPRGAVLKGRAIADNPVPIGELAEDSGIVGGGGRNHRRERAQGIKRRRNGAGDIRAGGRYVHNLLQGFLQLPHETCGFWRNAASAHR